MLRLTKYLKPYLVLLVVSIALLFGQAMADLALPNYMSEIVNVGIQQGGIESAVPAAIRQSQLEKATLFMSADEKAQVLANYTLVDSSSADYAAMVAKYPLLATEPVYELKVIDAATRTALTPIMGKSLTVVYAIQQAAADPTKAAALGANAGFDLTKVPAGTDLFSLLKMMPAAQVEKMTSAINEKFSAMSEKTITQAAAAAVKAEYTALGMDTAKVQSAYIWRIGGWMILFTFLSAVATITVGFLSARIAAGVARDLRRETFSKVESFTKAEFEKFSTASLITRSTNDITQLQMTLVYAHPHGLLRSDHWRWRHHPGSCQEPLHDLDHRSWCGAAAGIDHHGIHRCPAAFQAHPEPHRPA